MRPSQSSVWNKIPGWCTKLEGDYLYSFAATRPEGTIIVDLGTYMGRSATALGLGCLSSGARVISVDDFKGNPEHEQKPNHEQALIWLERVDPKLLGVITIVPEDAVAFGKQFVKRIVAFYVDTEHNSSIVLETFATWWPKLESRGHILFHDARNTGWTEVASTVQQISERWPMEELSGADSIRHFRKML
jgi:hypothetical protein